MCSEAKKKCIYAVSKELGIGVDWKELSNLSELQASERIDKLKAQLEKAETAPDSTSNEKTEEFNQWRFGMVVKIIFDKYPYGYLTANPKVFTREVRKVYQLVSQAEAQLKGQCKTLLAAEEDINHSER
jgi:hypothetical protein